MREAGYGRGAAPSGARSGFRAPAGADALRRLVQVTTELSGATKLDEVVDIAVAHLADAVGAAVSTLLLVEGDELVVAGQVGVADEKIRRWTRMPLEDANPASEAVRTRRPVVAATADEVRARYPRMAPDTPERRSVVCLPVAAGARVLGALGLTFDDNWQPGAEELQFLTALADSCAQTIERVTATARSSEKSAQLRFLAEASAELSRSLDYEATLGNVAQLAVGTLADWCAVDLLVDHRLATVAVAHVDPASTAWAWRFRKRYPPDPNAATGVAKVARTGRSELYAEVTDEMLVASARDDDHLRLTRELAPRSIMIVPLVTSTRPIGAITFVRSDGVRPFTADDLVVAEDLGRRAGVAIDNARLHEQATATALQFQHAMLPADLDQISGWEVASHYSPNGQAQVGGDFFDVVELPDGRVAAFIGDVAGHGLAAAAAMAQVRAATRAFLSVDPEPAAVVLQLDRMFDRLGIDTFVTLCYAVLGDGCLRVVNAGHCPPLIVDRAGRARFVAEAVRPPLGVPHGRMLVSEDPVADTDTVFLYTDGLVETRAGSLADGMSNLLTSAHTLADRALAAAVRHLVRELPDPSIGDDVACLALRTRHVREPRVTNRSATSRALQAVAGEAPAERGPTFFHQLPNDISAPGAARRWFAETVRPHLPHVSAIGELEVVLSELVTNAVLAGCQALVVAATLFDPGRLRVEVRDDAPGRPELLNAGVEDSHGRGIFIVSQLADAWGVDTVPTGKAVWAEFDL